MWKNSVSSLIIYFLLQILDKYPLTNFCAPPTVYRHLVKQPLHRYSLSKNLLCIGAGEPVVSYKHKVDQ